MVELVPLPFSVLVTRMFREMERRKAIFDYPLRRMVTRRAGQDLSVSIHGHKAATPFGPAAGPHTQLAQNIVLAWLAGGRVMELKTVQIKDDLSIARPCIDMQTVGFNVEWSQELSLPQSLEEYVKASMLIRLLQAQGLAEGFDETVFDMSVGYDLAGIRSPKVGAFLASMKDATPIIERLRREIPDEWAHLRDLAFPRCISDTLTLSTFHGCPPDEIERIGAFLLEEAGLHLVVKLNPTLLGESILNGILRDRLGYRDLEVPAAAFAKDAKWEQAIGIVERLGTKAEALGQGFGVKFSNTLLAKNHKAVFPSTEREMYMSGRPLHVLAVNLVNRFRATFNDRFPISFSAGIDAGNFADVVALGIRPVSVCSDLLKVGGYGRAQRYFTDLQDRMAALGARDIDQFILKAYDQAQPALMTLGLDRDRQRACLSALADGNDPRQAAGEAYAAWLSAAKLLNTRHYVEKVMANPRYGAAENAIGPKKTGGKLSLFDCLTCDKCIPVCPNNANFALPMAPVRLPIEWLERATDGWILTRTGEIALVKPHQIATYADACNECGNCDIMCPEDGGPYLTKPLFFGALASFEAARDGFFLDLGPQGWRIQGRFEGSLFRLEECPSGRHYTGDGFDIRLDPDHPAETAEGRADKKVPLVYLWIMEHLRQAIQSSDGTNYVSARLERDARKSL